MKKKNEGDPNTNLYEKSVKKFPLKQLLDDIHLSSFVIDLEDNHLRLKFLFKSQPFVPTFIKLLQIPSNSLLIAVG